MLPTNIQTILPAAPYSDDDFVRAFATFLKLNIANGDARPDTIKTYISHIGQFREYCSTKGLSLAEAKTADIEEYRGFLLAAGKKRETIALKLTVIRRFYDAAMARGLIMQNPASGVRPPKNREPEQKIKWLTAGEAQYLFKLVPADGNIKNLRDKAMLALMALQGLRLVEVHRANVADIQKAGGKVRILVHGKGKDRYMNPREDTMAAINEYLAARPQEEINLPEAPLFVCIDHKGGGGRLSRDGIRLVVDNYLKKAGLKSKGVSCHCLRHTTGALLYIATKSVKVVQEELGHASINYAAHYSHIIDSAEAVYTKQIPVRI